MGGQSLRNDEKGLAASGDPAPFSIEKRPLADGCVQIRIGGELDLATSDRLVKVLDEILSSRAHIVLDLERCSFLDSTGIAVILRARRQLADRGRALCVVGARNAVARVLHITGLMASDLVQSDLEAALLTCRQSPPVV